jgi:hypothetical protein
VRAAAAFVPRFDVPAGAARPAFVAAAAWPAFTPAPAFAAFAPDAGRAGFAPFAAVPPAGADGVNSLTGGARGQQQAERAKFWAQFQETWQQVRETKRLKEDGEPGTPSSGTAWTETTVGRHH